MRRSILEPIPEIFEAAGLLAGAVAAHLDGDAAGASKLFVAANKPAVWAWTDWGWGTSKRHLVHAAPVAAPKCDPIVRDPKRAPDSATRRALVARDGYRCRYCGLPVIDSSVRKRAHELYPEAVPWGSRNKDQHAAFQCLWLQFDHIVAHSQGGRSDLDNMVVTCAVCNFGKEEYSLYELDLEDPRHRPPVITAWDGLVGLLQ
jgi:5-methylcytosine-specific restriction endonuclease McrA